MLFLYPSEGRVMLLLFWTDGSNLLVFNPYAEDCWLCTQSRDLTVLHLRVNTCWLFTPNGEDLLICYTWGRRPADSLGRPAGSLLVMTSWFCTHLRMKTCWFCILFPTWEWRPAGGDRWCRPSCPPPGCRGRSAACWGRDCSTGSSSRPWGLSITNTRIGQVILEVIENPTCYDSKLFTRGFRWIL